MIKDVDVEDEVLVVENAVVFEEFIFMVVAFIVFFDSLVLMGFVVGSAAEVMALDGVVGAFMVVTGTVGDCVLLLQTDLYWQEWNTWGRDLDVAEGAIIVVFTELLSFSLML